MRKAYEIMSAEKEETKLCVSYDYGHIKCGCLNASLQRASDLQMAVALGWCTVVSPTTAEPVIVTAVFLPRKRGS